MPKSTKLSELIVEEASGVDHPAHLHEGWIVMKSTELDEALDSLDEETHTSTQGEPEVELQTENEVTETVEETVVEEEVVETTPEPTPVLASVEGPETHSAVEKENTDLRKELDDIRKAHSDLVEERELEKAIHASSRWAILPELNPTEFAPVLRSLRAADPESAAKIEQIFDAATVALGEAGVLKELGTDSAPEGETAWAQIESQAQELVSSGASDSIAKAVTQIAEEQPELYKAYMTEKGF